MTERVTDMSGITVVEFENSVYGEEIYLSSELSDGPPYTVHGIALGAGDVTRGKSGIKKKWPAEELRQAAESLQGTNLVVDHENSSHGVIGRVTKAGYKDGVGVVYEAELFDDDLAEKVEKGLLEVSVRGLHADVDSLEEDSDTEALIVEDIEFKNLSVVPSGAAPSNTLQMGEHAELSAAELASFTQDISTAELQEIEPGMWVKWGDNRGVTISQVQDGEIEVDLYEEQDGQWRSIEETEMVDTSDLSEWDVDEENIGPAQDSDDGESDSSDEEDDSDSDEEENAESNSEPDLAELVSEGDMVEWDSSGGMASGVVVERKSDGCFSDRIDGDQEICADDDDPVVLIEITEDGERTDTMVAHKESTLRSAEENSAVDRGEFVKWRDHDSNWRYGQIIEIDQEGRQMVATLRRFTESGDKLDETERKPLQGLDRWDESPEDGSDSNTVETETDDSDSDGSSDDVTINDLLNVLSSVAEAAATTTDVPSEETQPTHSPMGSMAGLFEQFIEEEGSPDATMADFLDWLDRSAELAEGEGEDDVLDSKEAIRRMKENDAAYMATVHQDEEELAQSFDDYPEAAQENAQMALDARDETDNPNDCGTDAGWTRANQLASGESLSAQTVKRMAQFNRHRSNSEMDDDEGKADCGWMMWKAWGGDEGVDWAKRTVEQEELEDIPTWREGQMVKWQPNPDMQGKIVHVDEERKVLMVELVDESGDMSGYTITAGYTDVVPADSSASDEGKDMSEEEMSDEVELQDYEMHEVTFDGTTEADWSSPDMEDFDTDDLGEIASHFIISSSGFPPENFGDLALPVVEPSGELNVNALAAVKGGRGVSAVDGLTSDMEDEIVEYVNGLANREFDKDWGKDEEENAMAVPEGHRFRNEEDAVEKAQELGIEGAHQMEFDGETMWVPGNSHEEYVDAVSEQSGHKEEMTGVRVLPGDDLRQAYNGASDADSLTQYKVITMNEEIEEKLSELEEPVALEAEELQELQDKADRFEEMTESLEELRERTEILDEVDSDSVEELRDADEPVVVESARFEELTSEADQVKGVYAAQLAEHYDAFDEEELADKFSIEELREKYEDQFGSIEELADSSEAEPRSQDPSEEELEEESEEGESEEELSDDVAAKQDEIRAKLGLGGD